MDKSHAVSSADGAGGCRNGGSSGAVGAEQLMAMTVLLMVVLSSLLEYFYSVYISYKQLK